MYRFPVLLQLKADSMDNTFFNATNQLSLGVANMSNNSWSCSSRVVSSYDSSSGMIGYTVPRDGVYAVIFNPIPYITPPMDACSESYICTYRYFLIGALIFLLGILSPLSYLFWRMYRYVVKYRETKEKEKNTEQVLQEVLNTETDTPFQSVKDKLDGIVFRKNPLLKKVEDVSEEIGILRTQVEALDKERKEIDKDRRELLDKHNYYSREIMKLRKELERINNKNRVNVDYTDISVEKQFEWSIKIK